MADAQAPSQPTEAQGGGAGAALEALQAAAASVQASVRAAEAICAALQPMVGALELAPPTRRVGHERRRGAGAELATVQRQGELLQQSVESLEGLVAQDGEADPAAEQASHPAGPPSLHHQHAGSHAGVHAAVGSAGAADAQALGGEAALTNAAMPQPRPKRRRPKAVPEPAAPKRQAIQPGKMTARKSRDTEAAPLKRNWRYEDQLAHNAWAAAHPTEASIDAEWEPADVIATGSGSQGALFLVSWKGWEDEAALRSWHTGEDLRRYGWRPAMLQQRAAGKPDRGTVARM